MSGTRKRRQTEPMVLDKKKYIGLEKGVLMYLTKGKYNLLSEEIKEDSRYYRFFTVNKTGKDVVMSITGSDTVEELEKNIAKKLEFLWKKIRNGWMNFLRCY